jgi:hypothetical protein
LTQLPQTQRERPKENKGVMERADTGFRGFVARLLRHLMAFLAGLGALAGALCYWLELKFKAREIDL